MSELLWTFTIFLFLDVQFSLVYSLFRSYQSQNSTTMNTRQENLLTYLNNSQNYEPISVIADHFSVSTKTIHRDLEVIKSFLSKIDGHIDVKWGKGIKLIANRQEINKFLKKLSDTNPDSQDPKERNLIQAFSILFSTIGPIPLKAFGSMFFISRSQLMLDLNHLRDIFSPYQVELTFGSNGIWAKGNEKDLRDLTAYLLSVFLVHDYPIEKIVYPDSIQKGLLTTKNLITEDDLNFVHIMLVLIENFSQKRIRKQDYYIIFTSLLAMIKRKTIIAENTSDSVKPKFINDSKSTLLQQIVEKVEEEYKLTLKEEEIEFLNNVFLSTGLVHDPAFSQTGLPQTNRQRLIHDFSEDFIDAFTTITDINLRDKTLFCERIHLHIEPMINRVLFNLGITNPYLDSYTQEYQGTMNVCEVICWILSKKYGLPQIPRSEILFLMLYIQTEIIEDESRLKVGFLSNIEKSITNLQLAQLEKEFPHWEFVQYQSLNQSTFYKDYLEFVIVSKGSPFTADVPHVEVSPKMSDLDLNLIRSAVSHHAIKTKQECTKLKNTFRDLIDLGCSIEFGKTPEEAFDENFERLQIAGVGNCIYNYFDKGTKSNALFVQYPDKENKNIEFYFVMNNWDFLLFASKIVFLVDHTSKLDNTELISEIAAHLKEIDV